MRITVASLMRVADRYMDRTLRALLMERAMRLPAGTWSNNLGRWLKEAPGAVGADPAWFASTDYKLEEALVYGARQVNVPPEIAEGAVAELFEAKQLNKLALYMLDKGIFETESGLKQAKGLLRNRGKQWGMDYIRNKRNQISDEINTNDRDEDDGPSVNPSTEWGTNYSGADMVRAMLNLASIDPRFRASVLDALEGSLDARGLSVADYYLNRPGVSQKEMADDLSIPVASMNGLFKKVFTALTEVVKDDPDVARRVEIHLQDKGSAALKFARKT